MVAAALEALIEAEGPDTIAAFFAEPVMGAGGAILPPEGYFDKMQAVLRKHDILFVADEYWLIEDQLIAQAAHDYQLRFHLTPDALGRVAMRRSPGCSTTIAPGIALVVVGDVTAAVLEDGWVSQEYGIKHRAPVAVFTADRAAHATLVTLVAPLVRGQVTLPTLTVDRSFDERVANVAHGSIHDEVIWTIGESHEPFDRASGAAAQWRRRTTARVDR